MSFPAERKETASPTTELANKTSRLAMHDLDEELLTISSSTPSRTITPPVIVSEEDKKIQNIIQMALKKQQEEFMKQIDEVNKSAYDTIQAESKRAYEYVKAKDAEYEHYKWKLAEAKELDEPISTVVNLNQFNTYAENMSYLQEILTKSEEVFKWIKTIKKPKGIGEFESMADFDISENTLQSHKVKTVADLALLVKSIGNLPTKIRKIMKDMNLIAQRNHLERIAPSFAVNKDEANRKLVEAKRAAKAARKLKAEAELQKRQPPKKRRVINPDELEDTEDQNSSPENEFMDDEAVEDNSFNNDE